MRDLTKIKAEIFRRSNEKIKKRRRTRNQLLICLPVFLCVAVLPFVLPKNTVTSEELSNSATQTLMPTREINTPTNIPESGGYPSNDAGDGFPNANTIYLTLSFNGRKIDVSTIKADEELLRSTVDAIKNKYSAQNYNGEDEHERMGIYIITVNSTNRKYGVDISNNLFIDYGNKCSYSLENTNELEILMKIFNVK